MVNIIGVLAWLAGAALICILFFGLGWLLRGGK